MGLAGAAREVRSPPSRLRAGECVHRHQRVGAQQRERQREEPGADYLRKAAAIADAFRPYGVRVYLSAHFSAPIELGGLKTADPLDPEVKTWWSRKADEIYKLIPDFGGFLVKANSEGQPGPRTYNRSHADGANMLAAALAPHHGVVIWRAFVYDAKPAYDRAAAAYDELQPLDGRFAPNVLLQVKNGPVDFQPREPFHPLFGAMPRTPMVMEVQITQEYLGHANHLVFLAPMWREALDADTFAKGPGSSVSKVIDGSLFGSASRAWPASPTPDRTGTGPATRWRRRTGTRSAGWRGTLTFLPGRSPRSGRG